MTAECAAVRDVISATADHESNELERRHLRRHLSGCSPCRRYADAVHGLQHRVERRPAPADRTTEILDAVARADPASRVSTPRSMTRVVRAAAAAIVALGAGSVALAYWADRDPRPVDSVVASVSGLTAPAPAGASTAIYLTVRNEGGADRLVKATSPDAERVQIHRTDRQDGVTVMSRRGPQTIAGDATTVLAPDGIHLMLQELQRDLRVGDRVDIRLTFDNAATQTVTLDVVEPGQIPGD